MSLLKIILDKEKFKNRRGSYIFEAAMLLPIVFGAVIMLSLIIPVFSVCEGSVYIACDELRNSNVRSVLLKYDVAFPVKIKQRMEEQIRADRFDVKRFSQGVRRFGTDDLTLLSYEVNIINRNPAGFAEEYIFDGKIMSRAFTGRKENGSAMSEDDFLKKCNSEKVFIFPKRGEKYHKENCKYLKPACKSICLTNKIKRKWETCEICKSENIKTGAMVFCFMSSGRVYHSGECSTVRKCYIEMEKFYAEKRGYKPCSACYG